MNIKYTNKKERYVLKPNCIYATPLPKQKKENNRAYTLSLAHKHRHQKRAMKTTSRTNKIKSYVWSNRLICSNDEERYLNLTVFFLFSFSLSINCKYKTLCVLYVAHHNTANRIQLVWMGLEMYMRTIRENDRGDISVWNLLPDFGQVWVCSHVSAVVCACVFAILLAELHVIVYVFSRTGLYLRIVDIHSHYICERNT